METVILMSCNAIKVMPCNANILQSTGSVSITLGIS